MPAVYSALYSLRRSPPEDAAISLSPLNQVTCSQTQYCTEEIYRFLGAHPLMFGPHDTSAKISKKWADRSEQTRGYV